MIFVGIDVAKDKHDCFITNSDDEVLFHSFSITITSLVLLNSIKIFYLLWMVLTK